MRVYPQDINDNPAFHCYENIMDVYYPELCKIDLIKMHIWSFLDVEDKIHNKRMKLYYEIKNRNNWETSIKCIDLTMKEFIYGFMNCVYDNKENETIIPYLRCHIAYFKNELYAKQNYSKYIQYNFNAVRDIEQAILNFVTYDNKKFQQEYMVYSINYYNNTCSLNNHIKHILNNHKTHLT